MGAGAGPTPPVASDPAGLPSCCQIRELLQGRRTIPGLCPGVPDLRDGAWELKL